MTIYFLYIYKKDTPFVSLEYHEHSITTRNSSVTLE